jgi:glucosyl-3-phosphoglycerate phosphatase
MSARHLFLVRHGESAYNAEHRMQGQADAPLSELGRQQAGTIRDLVAGLPADHVLASDLARARDTAELAGLTPEGTDSRWRERGMGEWEAQLEADIGEDALGAFRRGELVPPGGETQDEFVGRIGGAIDDLTARGGSWLVVTHGGCVRAAVAHLTGAEYLQVAGPLNVSLSTFELAPRPRVLRFNWTADGGLPRASDPGGADATAPGGQSA